jgi:hypothetical protein
MAEFVDSFQTMSQVGPAVTIFGSARTKPSDKYYRAAHDIAKGPGQSTTSPSSPAAARASWRPPTRARRRAAANPSASTSNCRTSRRQPLRQRADPFPLFFCAQGLLREIQPRLRFHARRFRHARRIFEVLTLVQTQRIPQFPLILFGSEHWKGLLRLDEIAPGKGRLHQPRRPRPRQNHRRPDEVIEIIRDYERRVGPPEVCMPKAFA